MSIHEQTPLLTVNELAKLLSISRDSVYRLVRGGTIPYVKVGERMRFRQSEIDAYLAANTIRYPHATTSRVA